MPRYNDRHGNDYHGSTRLYVGRLSSRTRSRDLQDLFSRYGRVRDVDMKHDFAFVDFSDPRDADDAMYNLNGRDFDGSRIIVEFAKGGPRGSGGSREYLGRGPPPGSGRCFNCGLDGHWARDCKAGDWKNKCYRCGERGHIERNCQNSPKSTKHGRSYSRSVSRSPSRRGRNRSRSISRSYSRSRSPVHKRERSVERVEKRSRSPAYSRSPERRGSPPHRGRKRSPSPERSRSPRQRASSPPPMERQGSDYSQSPRLEKNSRSPRMEMNSRSPRMEKNSSSPVSQDGGSPPPNRQYSPETNGQNGRSPSPREDNVDEGASPMGSESPRD